MEVDKMAFIYKITNDINGHVYIGQTSYSVQQRFQEHYRDVKRDTSKLRPLQRAIQKYGIEHFHIEIIEETDYPNEREIYWIEKFNSYENGNYNATRGGEGRTLYNHNEILARLKEFPYPKQVADEFGCSPDIVRKIAKSNCICIHSASQDGLVPCGMKPRKKIAAYTKDDVKIIEFNSVGEAAQWCVTNNFAATLNSGVSSHIAEAANGKRKSAYKHKWKYIE